MSVKDDYTAVRRDLENLVDLLKSLQEFNYMFTIVPSGLTQDSYQKSHDSNAFRYSPYYVGKKKHIKNQSDNMKENFGDMSRYSGVSTDINQSELVEYFTTISTYFGEAAGGGSASVLPAQYVDACLIRDNIVSSLGSIIGYVVGIKTTVKAALDAFRGSAGIGNKNISDLLTDAQTKTDLEKKVAGANSPNGRSTDATLITEIKETNRIQNAALQKIVDEFKGVVLGGMKSISPVFIQNNTDALLRVSLQGMPVTSDVDRQRVLEATVRTKVRNKLGQGKLPFCDETIVTVNGVNIFALTKDLDPYTGKIKTSQQGRQLQKAAMAAAKTGK